MSLLLALDSSTGINSVAQFFTVLLIFVGVLALTYFTTKFVAGYQKSKMSSGNINVLETFRVSNNKYIQIVRVGDKVFAIAVAKDNVTLLGELNEDSLSFPEPGEEMSLDFKEVFKNATNFKKK